MPIKYDEGGEIKRPNKEMQLTPDMVQEFINCARSVIHFAENHYWIINPISGEQKINLFDFQKEILQNLQDHRFNILLASRQIGKALTLDTPIITPNGFKTIKELNVGDEIFGQDGEKTKIIFITDIMFDKDIYEIEFDTGEKIKACSEHLWEVYYKNKKYILKTEEILDIYEEISIKSCCKNFNYNSIKNDEIKNYIYKVLNSQKSNLKINNIKKIDTEPVKCLQVDNKDHLFLCGKSLIPTHNTTCSAIFLLWYSMFNRSKTVAILANKADNAKAILAEIKFAYEKTPEYLKPGILKYDAFSIRFDNNSEIICRATSPDALRSLSVSLLMLDEFAFLANGISEAFWASNYPTISCLPKDTLILTENGFEEIDDYIPKNYKKGDYIEIDNLSTYGKNGIENVSHFYISPNSETKVLQTNYGLKHESTLDHPILSLDNSDLDMKKSEDIKIGDYIRIDYGMNIYGNKGNFTKNDGYIEGKQYNKTIPKYILRASKEVQEGFLAGYIDYNGSVSLRGDTTIKSNNEKILLHIQLLLLNMGIISKLNYFNNKYILKISRCFADDFSKLGLKNNKNQERLENTIVSLKEKSKQFKIPLTDVIFKEISRCFKESNQIQNYFRKNNVRLDKVLKKKAKYVTVEWLKRFINLCNCKSELFNEILLTPCFFDYVVSLYYSENDTYDFTCPKTNTFLQNGIMGSNTGGSIIVVSTPNGTGNLFYNLWKDAIDEKNSFFPTEVRWDRHPDRDEEWKKETIKNIGKIRFQQEYNCSFFGSSITLIDGSFIISHLKSEDPIKETQYKKYWKNPDFKRKYAIAIDVSQGVGSDFSVANVFDIADGPEKVEQVCCYRRNDLNVPEFTEIVYNMALEWNNAYLIIETNANLGEELQRTLFESPYEYENLFFDYERGKYGVYSTRGNKPVACSWFKDLLENQNIILKDEVLITEIGYFEEIRENVFKARPGKNCFDDTVICCIWLSYFLKSKYFEDIKDSWSIEEVSPEEVEDKDVYDKWQDFLHTDYEEVEDNWLDKDVNGDNSGDSDIIWW